MIPFGVFHRELLLSIWEGAGPSPCFCGQIFMDSPGYPRLPEPQFNEAWRRPGQDNFKDKPELVKIAAELCECWGGALWLLSCSLSLSSSEVPFNQLFANLGKFFLL